MPRSFPQMTFLPFPLLCPVYRHSSQPVRSSLWLTNTGIFCGKAGKIFSTASTNSTRPSSFRQCWSRRKTTSTLPARSRFRSSSRTSTTNPLCRETSPDCSTLSTRTLPWRRRRRRNRIARRPNNRTAARTIQRRPRPKTLPPRASTGNQRLLPAKW